MADPFNLARFVSAHAAWNYDQALAEIKAGEKVTHWMWFIFPQFEGLGHSPTAKKYAVRSREEARAYLAHPVLGPRLAECSEAAVAVSGRTAEEIFGAVDAMKLRSCATLFAEVSPAGSVFHRLLDKYYGGEPDTRTLALLANQPTSSPPNPRT